MVQNIQNSTEIIDIQRCLCITLQRYLVKWAKGFCRDNQEILTFWLASKSMFLLYADDTMFYVTQRPSYTANETANVTQLVSAI